MYVRTIYVSGLEDDGIANTRSKSSPLMPFKAAQPSTHTTLTQQGGVKERKAPCSRGGEGEGGGGGKGRGGGGVEVTGGCSQHNIQPHPSTTDTVDECDAPKKRTGGGEEGGKEEEGLREAMVGKPRFFANLNQNVKNSKHSNNTQSASAAVASSFLARNASKYDSFLVRKLSHNVFNAAGGDFEKYADYGACYRNSR
jgi:hypothetical protein